MTDDSGFRGPLDSFFDEFMPQALKFFDDQAFEFGLSDRMAEPVTIDPRKQVSYIDVPVELLMDMGAIPDTRPPRPPLPWRWRLRNRVAGWREKLAYRAFRAIAGYDAPDYAGDE